MAYIRDTKWKSQEEQGNNNLKKKKKKKTISESEFPLWAHLYKQCDL